MFPWFRAIPRISDLQKGQKTRTTKFVEKHKNSFYMRMSLLILILSQTHYIYLCEHAHIQLTVAVYMPQHACLSQRKTSRSLFSLSIIWILGFEVKSLGLVASTFMY